MDVVFSDVIRPGMDGIEMGQESTRLDHDLPVVLASGYSRDLARDGPYGLAPPHQPGSIEQLSHMLRRATRVQWRERIIDRSASGMLDRSGRGMSCSSECRERDDAA